MGQLADDWPLASSTSLASFLEVNTKKSFIQPNVDRLSPSADNFLSPQHRQAAYQHQDYANQLRISNEKNGNQQYLNANINLMLKSDSIEREQVEQYNQTSKNCNMRTDNTYKFQIDNSHYQQQSFESQFQQIHEAPSQFIISEVNGDLIACDHQSASGSNDYVEHESIYANWTNSLESNSCITQTNVTEGIAFNQSNVKERGTNAENNNNLDHVSNQSYSISTNSAYTTNDYNNNQQQHSISAVQNTYTADQAIGNQEHQFANANLFQNDSDYHHHIQQHDHQLSQHQNQFQYQNHDNYNYQENAFVQQQHTKFRMPTDEQQQLASGYDDSQHTNTLIDQTPNQDLFYSHPQQRQQYFQSTDRLESQEGPIDTNFSNNNQHQTDASSFNQHPASQLDHYNSKSPHASLQQLTLECDNYANQVSTTTASNEEPLQATNKLRSLKGRRGRPRKKGLRSKNKVNGKLWEFIRDLLLNERTNPSFIRWERREDGVFKFVQSDKVAKMWGERKQNPKMTYEKLSRAMRYYYKSKVLLPVFGRRLVYKFGPNATGWLPESSNGTIY